MLNLCFQSRSPTIFEDSSPKNLDQAFSNIYTRCNCTVPTLFPGILPSYHRTLFSAVALLSFLTTSRTASVALLVFRTNLGTISLAPSSGLIRSFPRFMWRWCFLPSTAWTIKTQTRNSETKCANFIIDACRSFDKEPSILIYSFQKYAGACSKGLCDYVKTQNLFSATN